MKRKTKLILSLVLFSLILVTAVTLLLAGVISLNHPSKQRFPVRGVDVSSHQGAIDWKILSQQGINFAFIKATEGSSLKDPNFAENWQNASKTDLAIGAYHFFSYDSSGATQAQNFISSVPLLTNMLPPVVDLEFYGNKRSNPTPKVDTDIILQELLEKLETHYNKKPIIYATMRSYKMYIRDGDLDYPIWIRNVYYPATLQGSHQWTFWQYSDKAKLDGYNGREPYIDMNVFNGTLAELNQLRQ